MARYIDVDKKIEELNMKIESTKRLIENRPYDEEAKLILREHEFCLNELKNAPTADVEEVKHGAWKLKSETRRFLEEIDEDFYVECPFCNRVYYVPFEFDDEKMLEYAKKNYPYCNCGAKMDGERRKGNK